MQQVLRGTHYVHWAEKLVLVETMCCATSALMMKTCLQVILVVNQIYWCQEVEEAFQKMSKGGDKKAMETYNKLQVQQLTDLIQVTRTDLKKEDRQKVMNMITIDAHSRDMIEQVVDSGSDDVECFQWVCQLRTYWDKSIEDCRIRICDASFPYGYEYLGNGPRLVITPLTDRIYITATQARSPPLADGCRNMHAAAATESQCHEPCAQVARVTVGLREMLCTC
jgi:hypothetical protein